MLKLHTDQSSEVEISETHWLHTNLEISVYFASCVVLKFEVFNLSRHVIV
jgi:hypothetical protein